MLMMATLLQALPEARRFFVSERWGGYAKSSRDVDAVQNPVVMALLMAAWFVAVVLIVLGWCEPMGGAREPRALPLLLHPHAVEGHPARAWARPASWRTGPASPSFCSSTPAGLRRTSAALALLVLQVDLAFIMLSAGVYKFTAGYPHNHGMELGLCNPMWGYWWKWYAARRPDSAVFWTMNQLAWGTEVVAAVLMLIPPTRELGAVLLILSFLFILTQIRLGFLCEMVMLCGVLYVVPGGMLDRWIAAVAAPPALPLCRRPHQRSRR